MKLKWKVAIVNFENLSSILLNKLDNIIIFVPQINYENN
jgi:hypothetical protein